MGYGSGSGSECVLLCLGSEWVLGVVVAGKGGGFLVGLSGAESVWAYICMGHSETWE